MSQPLRAPAPVVGLVHELIEYAAERHGERPFLLRYVAGAWTGYTFMAAARAVREFAALLAREGVRPGARVGLQSDNRPEWGLAYLSVLAAGAVIVPLHLQLRERALAGGRPRRRTRSATRGTCRCSTRRGSRAGRRCACCRWTRAAGCRAGTRRSARSRPRRRRRRSPTRTTSPCCCSRRGPPARR